MHIYKKGQWRIPKQGREGGGVKGCFYFFQKNINFGGKGRPKDEFILLKTVVKWSSCVQYLEGLIYIYCYFEELPQEKDL